MKKIIIASLSAFLLISACKKDENATSGNLELTKYNLSGTYKAVDATFTLKNSSVAASIYTSAFSECKRDDLHIFDTSNVYTYADSGLKCTPPVNYSSSYLLKANNELNYNNSSYVVEKLTATDLVIAKDTSIFYKIPPDTIGTNFAGNFRLFFKRQ